MVNIGTLTAFLLVSIAIPVLRKSRPDLAALVQGAAGSPWLPWLVGGDLPVPDDQPDRRDLAAVRGLDGRSASSSTSPTATATAGSARGEGEPGGGLLALTPGLRFLFTFVGGAGHLDPLLPLARAVAAAGHTVAIAGSGNQMPRVEAQGFTALPTSEPRPASASALDFAPLTPVVPLDTEVEFAENFAGKGARRHVPAVGEHLRTWRPDVVVREETDFGSAMAAEIAGVPCATLVILAAGTLAQTRPGVAGPPGRSGRARPRARPDARDVPARPGALAVPPVVPRPFGAAAPDRVLVPPRAGRARRSRPARLRQPRHRLQHRRGRPVRAPARRPGGRPGRGARHRRAHHRPGGLRRPARPRHDRAVRRPGRRAAAVRARGLARWLGQPDGRAGARSALGADPARRRPAAQRPTGRRPRGGPCPRRGHRHTRRDRRGRDHDARRHGGAGRRARPQGRDGRPAAGRGDRAPAGAAGRSLRWATWRNGWSTSSTRSPGSTTATDPAADARARARRVPRRRQRRGPRGPAPRRPSPSGPVVATFDVDELHDYRARRPAMSFVRDHYESYDAPRLVVRLLRDAGGTPYLLLHGPEPDTRWEAFAQAVREVVERFGVDPRRRHGRRADGGAAHPPDRDHPARQQPRAASPATAAGGASCGSRRAPRRCSSCGWGSGATTRWASSRTSRTTSPSWSTPAPSAALLEHVERAGRLDHRPHRRCAPRPRSARPRSPATSPPTRRSARSCTALEQQYDAFTRAEESGSSLLAGDQPLPTGEEIGLQFEQFLAGLDRPDGRQARADDLMPASADELVELLDIETPRRRPLPRAPARDRPPAGVRRPGRRPGADRGHPHRPTRTSRCTRCTPTSCGPATRRCRSSTTSSGSATAARSRPGGSSRASTATRSTS